MLRSVLALVAVLAATQALAQTSSSDAANGTARQGEPLNDQTRPMPGANSYSHAEAVRRIERLGFGQVQDLHKDSHGIWRGMARSHGGSRPVWLDYRGRVGNF